MARTYSAAAGTALTITLASLPDGNGRKSAYIDNSTDRFEKVTVSAIIRSGSSTPTVGTLFEMWLYTGDGATAQVNTDDLSTGDVALTATPENARLIQVGIVTATTAKDFSIEVTGVDITGVDEWAIAIMNETGQTSDSTETNSFVNYVASKA